MNIKEALARMTFGRALIFGACIAAFYYFTMYDDGMNLQNGIQNSQNRINELQAQIQANQKKLDQAAVYIKTAAEVGSTITKALSLLPEQFGMADLMRIMSNETKAAGTSVAAIDPKGIKTSAIAPELEELNVSLDVSGSFLQHMVFLSNLTKTNQIIVVRSYNMNQEREGKGDEAPMVRMNADIVAYRYKSKGPEASPATKPGGGK